jgi:hypothetical protein
VFPADWVNFQGSLLSRGLIIFAPRKLSEHIRSSSRSFRDERRPRTAFQASDENVRRGRKRRIPIDGARTVAPSQARSGNRLQKLSVLIIEGRVVLSPSGRPPYFWRGTPPRYSRFCGADCVHLVDSFFGCGVFLCSPTAGIKGSTCVGIIEPRSMGCILIGPMGVGLPLGMLLQSR